AQQRIMCVVEVLLVLDELRRQQPEVATRREEVPGDLDQGAAVSLVKHETVESPAGELGAVAGACGADEVLHQAGERRNAVDQRLQARPGAEPGDRARRGWRRIPDAEV